MSAVVQTTRQDFYVYCLFRDGTGEPFYIGKGQGSRWCHHEWQARSGTRTHKAAIIRGMHARGIKVIKAKLHERLTEAVAHAYEIALIKAIGRGIDGPLVNLTDGGEGATGARHTLEIRAVIAAASTGRQKSLEERAKISAGRSGWKHSAEERAKMSAAQRGRIHSPETRAKMSDASRGKPKSAETRANMSAAQSGRTFSPEHAAKLSAVRRGKKQSAETRAKRAAALRGTKQPHSPEHIAKIAAALRGRKASAGARANISAATIGKPKSPEARANMAIAQRRRAEAMRLTNSVVSTLGPTQRLLDFGPLL